MKAIWKREMRGYFHTPVGYVFLGVFLAISSVLFYLDILSRRSTNLPGFLPEILKHTHIIKFVIAHEFFKFVKIFLRFFGETHNKVGP